MGEDNDGSSDNLKIFTGTKNSCDKSFANYNNCCSDSGWGQDYLGASCKDSEIQLMKSQEKKLCHYVGSYCSKKIPLIGTCQTNSKSYCCFGSKISRVINEQGKAQLGIGWGSGESPDCRGLTPAEMEKLQFDKMDLGEISADIASQAIAPNQSYIQDKVKNVVEGYGQKTSN
jgi:conjugal transfer mating pair stabilization protein TraN